MNWSNWLTKFGYPDYGYRNIVHSSYYSGFTKHDYMVMFYGTYMDQVLPWYYDEPYDYTYEDEGKWLDTGGKSTAYVICERT